MLDPTPEQELIYNHDPGRHACIVAGPGTGKSTTIISYIAKVREANPGKVIRLLTFTRAANGELADKIIEAGHSSVRSSTVHSFAISVLLSNPGSSDIPQPLRIADDWEWKELIREDLARRLTGGRTKEIEKLKNEMSAHWESLVPQPNTTITTQLRARFMGLWDEHRRIFGYTLLAELPFRLKIALESHPDLDVGHLDLLAVDEYQDLNACDLACLRLLTSRGVSLIGIGDDDQSIYKWRKADPAGIRNFSRDFSAPSYPLTVSHRCGQRILAWANYVIEGDTTRLTKPSLRPGEGNPEGVTKYLAFNRENSEASGICRLIKWLVEEKRIPPEEILILVRTESIRDLIEQELDRIGIPFLDPSVVLDKLKETPSRRLLSMLRLLVNQTDSLAWWTLMKLTPRIGPVAIEPIYQTAREQGRSFGELVDGITGSESHLSRRLETLIQETKRALAVIEVPGEARWGQWILQRIEAGRLSAPAEGVDEMLRKIDESEVEDDERSLGQFISQIEPTIKDLLNAKTPGKVRIMSLGQSKGLTVEATIIAGAEDGIIPLSSGDRQEERRLLYVGMTRAKQYLFITRARRRIGPTARTGIQNVGGMRVASPFLVGGPIGEEDGETALSRLGA